MTSQKHSVPKETVAEQIAAGPTFQAQDGHTPCACGATGYHDMETGLCTNCWRTWRFSAQHESHAT